MKKYRPEIYYYVIDSVILMSEKLKRDKTHKNEKSNSQQKLF